MMPPRNKKINPTICYVIVHGKSEYEMIHYIKSAYRLKMEIEGRDKGALSIQIRSLINFLDKHFGDDLNSFLRKHEDDLITQGSGSNKKIKDFCIFTIMDTDDCDNNEAKSYINKNMFKGKWYEPYIVPIHNSPKLEIVLRKGNFPYTINEKKKGESYVRIFPGRDMITTKEAKINLLKQATIISKSSNLHNLISYCEDRRTTFGR